MINILSLDPRKEELLELNKYTEEKILTRDGNNILWLDLEDPTDEEITILANKFKFHELAVEDCIFAQSQPKIDDFGDYLFIIFHGVNNTQSNKEELEVYDLNIFIGRNFIITIHDKKIPIITNLLKRCIQKPYLLLRKGPDYILHAIIDFIIDNYSPTLDEIEDSIDIIEDEILKNPTSETMTKIFNIKKKILFMRRILEQQKVVINLLSKRTYLPIKRETILYFRDIHDHITRISGFIDTHRETITSLLEVYLAGLSVKVSEIIKSLTIIGSIFLPPMLIASYYGMNVDFPEVNRLGSFVLPFIWLVTIGITVGLLLLFKKKRWI